MSTSFAMPNEIAKVRSKKLETGCREDFSPRIMFYLSFGLKYGMKYEGSISDLNLFMMERLRTTF